MSTLLENGYEITDEHMLLMSILKEIEKEDDEEAFNTLRTVIAKKNGLIYYPLKKDAIVGFDEFFPEVAKTDKNMLVEDLLAHILSNEDLILGYSTLTKKRFKGFISKIGEISGENVYGRDIKPAPIYNKVPTKVIGILPVEDINESGDKPVIKYILVCAKNNLMDLIYKTITISTFVGLLAYNIYKTIETVSGMM